MESNHEDHSSKKNRDRQRERERKNENRLADDMFKTHLLAGRDKNMVGMNQASLFHQDSGRCSFVATFKSRQRSSVDCYGPTAYIDK